MNKLDSHPLAPSYAISHADPGPARRLIVLVPDPEADTANAAPRVWELANSLGSSVQFIGLCRDEVQESSLRRKLITLAALMETSNIQVESKIEFGNNWLDAVKSNWQAGDAIVCFAGQPSGLAHRPLGQLLEASINAPVYVLDGLYPTVPSRPNWLTAGLAWTGSIGIITGFFWLQVKLIQMPGDWTHTTLMYLSLLGEVGVIWGWNSLFS
jgi:hypothetical protein